MGETVLKQQPPRNSLSEDMDWSRPNPFCQERSDCAIEARQDDIKEAITYGEKKQKRIEHSSAATPSSLQYTRPSSSAEGRLYIESTSQNKFGELDAESQKSCDNHCTNKPLSMSANAEVFSFTRESKQDEKFIDKCMVTTQKQAGTPASSQTAKKTRPLAGQKEVVPVLTGSKMKPHDIAKFIVMVIRTLRHTRDNDMQKLFEILSVPDFPVEKCSFLEELIQQAHCYNKEGVAKELDRYRSEIMTSDFHEHKRLSRGPGGDDLNA